jgi:16S rRNA (cytidine1402-2'-O)-methyltransferase
VDHEASTDPDSSSDPSSSAAAPAGSDELADSAGRTEQDLRSGGPGRIVLAATPIGNVGDASARLVELLATADIVAAEDTRRLHRLVQSLNVTVSGRIISYHEHNEAT